MTSPTHPATTVPVGVSAPTWRRFLRGATVLIPILAVQPGDTVDSGTGPERMVVDVTLTDDSGHRTVDLHLVPVGHPGEPGVLSLAETASIQATRPVSRRGLLFGQIQAAVSRLRDARRYGRTRR